MAILKLENINKIYDNGFHAVHNFNLEVKDKEFIVLVGPSGCGKSTTLRMIAGLEEITLGEFKMDDRLMNKVNPKDRDIAIVFQSYALYPHMNVYENMAFGLRLRKMEPDEVDLKVKEAANILGLTEYLERKPRELSGGQRQRVALGRAITRKPKVFLMDEPLSNLDAKLRVHMRSEIIKIHQSSNAITIYVTHDQIEAMTMADRIVIMKDGFVQQIGTPNELYHSPNNVFVAGFIGDPPMNFFHGIVDKNGVFTCSKNKNFHINIGNDNLKKIKTYLNQEIIIGIRPEDTDVDKVDISPEEASFNVDVNLIEMLGDYSNIYCELKNDSEAEPTQLISRIPSKQKVDEATPSVVSVPHAKMHFFDAKTTLAIK